MDYFNKRKYDRVKYPLLIRINNEGGGAKDFTVNISKGWCFIHTRSLYSIGEVLKFDILNNFGELLFSGEGVVVWQRTEKESPKEHGCGIRFTKIPNEALKIIEEIVIREKERTGIIQEYSEGGKVDQSQ